MYPASLQIVARTTNRLYVDLPVCEFDAAHAGAVYISQWLSRSGREPGYLQLCIDFTSVVFLRGKTIGLFPKFLRPYVVPNLFATERLIYSHTEFLAP
jgi:hypothetical protein